MFPMRKLEVTYKGINDIVPYAGNAKKHPKEQVEQIANSIQEFGFNDPIAVDENGMIIEGHGRLLAAKELGIETVPVIVLDGLDEQAKKAYILAHNQLTLSSGFDIDALQAELDAITDFDMSDFGFDEHKFSNRKEATEDDFDAPLPATPVSQNGDIWQCGRHRVMCGDSTDASAVSTLMSGTKADLLVTDPPYGVSIGSKNAKLEEYQKSGRITEDIDNDTKTSDELETVIVPALSNARDNCKPCSACYVFTAAGEYFARFFRYVSMAGWNARHGLIWVKNTATFSLGSLDYDYQHEPIIYGWSDSHEFFGHHFGGDWDTSVFEDDIDVDALSEKQAKKLLRQAIKATKDDSTSVLHYDKQRKCDLHPTMKPVPLIGKLITNSTRVDGVVLDVFGGSGTTMIAAEQLGRTAFLMESDPRYVDVIVRRWEELTGEHAVRL